MTKEQIKTRRGALMGKKSTIDPIVQKIIKTSVDEAVKKATEAIKKANEEADAGQRNYFKETERLLYSLPALRLKVAQDEEDLKNGLVILRERSRDIVRISGSGGYGACDPETREEKYIAERKASMERTKREIQRIERALETIQEDPYYDIIPLKYWDGLKLEEISERMNCDMSTVCRAKNRLVNKLKIVLFGADAL